MRVRQRIGPQRINMGGEREKRLLELIKEYEVLSKLLGRVFTEMLVVTGEIAIDGKINPRLAEFNNKYDKLMKQINNLEI